MQWILISVVVVLVLVMFLFGYVKAKPDEAVVISGLRKKPKIVVGKAAFRIPFLERVDRLNLAMLKIDVKTQQPVKNSEFIDITVDAVVTVKLSSKDGLLEEALKNFLNKKPDYIGAMVCDVLEGNIREIIGEMTLQQMVQNRKVFGEKVQQNAVPDMESMGIEIISFNVQNFSDGEGILTDLGMDNTMKIRKEASIVKAEAEKEIKVAQSIADRQANDARIAAEQEIAIKNNELEIKKSELKKQADIKQAEADAAYKIQEETQRKQIETTVADADLEKATKRAIVKEKEVEIERLTLSAEIEAKAKADRVKAQEESDAELYKQQKRAEAERYLVEQEAIATKARAEAARIEQEELAKGIRAKALAEAEGIKAKGLAEAEAIDKKAEAMKKYGEAAVFEMYFNALPDVAKAVAEPLNAIDSITMYGEGNAAKMTEDITKSLSQVMNGVNDGLGIDMKALLAGFVGANMVKQPGNTIIVPTVEKMMQTEVSTEEVTTEV